MADLGPSLSTEVFSVAKTETRGDTKNCFLFPSHAAQKKKVVAKGRAGR